MIQGMFSLVDITIIFIYVAMIVHGTILLRRRDTRAIVRYEQAALLALASLLIELFQAFAFDAPWWPVAVDGVTVLMAIGAMIVAFGDGDEHDHDEQDF